LGPILLSIHNITYYQRLLAGARAAIVQGRFEEFRLGKMERWGPACPAEDKPHERCPCPLGRKIL
jgi:tRNA-guanine family transglycosylase